MTNEPSHAHLRITDFPQAISNASFTLYLALSGRSAEYRALYFQRPRYLYVSSFQRNFTT